MNSEHNLLRLRIEALMSVKPFNDPSNVILTDFSGSAEFICDGCSKSVSGAIKATSDRSGSSGRSAIFSASAAGAAVQEGLYIKMVKKFDPWLDINKNQALGVWIKGDGNGELLNIRIESPKASFKRSTGRSLCEDRFYGMEVF